GRSLGGAVASWLAAQKQPAATILESTFTSAADLGADLYPWLPVRSIIKYDYDTLANIRQIESPLFMAHSRDDEIVPYQHGEKLFQAANEPKTFVELRGSHGSGFWETGEKYRKALQQF
ncbi:MAG: alpha/beta hydrolase, partial [Aliifodinibius sp.]|nr:alpha/beta hydrolase [Fodinibius sp.]NIV11120.1 alpha/beta hydrolase [Fodinibius sp.]NIY24702.1 alpha/beta hydrolase [Fodinibius sp.]